MRLAALLLIVSSFSLYGQTRQIHTAAASDRSAQLPVTRVALYKSGVGFFEHAGSVTGSQPVTIDLTTAQLNDVLETLTAIDLGGGRISGALYNSSTPLEQQLKALPLALDSPTADDLYGAIRGAHVAVSGAGGSFSGRVLDLETRSVAGAGPQGIATEKRMLTVISDAGAIRTFELTGATEVRLLDTTLHTDLNRYLETIANYRSSQGLRHLTLDDEGTGARRLSVSYISEVPVWKSTYRILITSAAGTAAQKATVQGWSVVDNTTGSDWNNVQLSLIAGAPQSFLQPIAQPIYARRPEIPIAQQAQLTPQTHDSGEMAAGVASMAGMAGGDGAPGIAGMAGMGGGSGVPGGVMGGIGKIPNDVKMLKEDGAPPVSIEYEAAASASLNSRLASASGFDDFFEYRLAQPVTIRKNESALVPILQAELPVERVTLWSPGQAAPLRALWITNSSGLTLDRGSFAIVENGNFGGEGLLDAIHPNERRLLSYAADQAVHVSKDPSRSRDRERTERITVSKGVLSEQTDEVSEMEYLVRNAATEARTVIVEQPVLNQWKLDSDTVAEETTPTAYRFRVVAQPGETAHLHIGQRRVFSKRYELVNTSDDEVAVILRDANAGPEIRRQLEPVLGARRAVADLDAQIGAKQGELNRITSDQQRLRANLASLKGSSEERALAKRYTQELNGQEDRIAGLQRDLDGLHERRNAAEEELEERIDSLEVDEALS